MENKPRSLHHCTYEGCNSVFNRPYRLAQHLLGHKNVKAFQCPESKCKKAYSNKSHLDRHIKSAHQVPEKNIVYSCPTCFKAYANRQNLKRHINIHHKDKIPLTCDICRLNFRKKHQLTAHMYQHTGIKSFSCELCHKEFVTLPDKKKHARAHKTYSCSECLAKFHLWSKYQKHLKTDHAIKEFICNECDRHFKQRSHIVRHIKMHLKFEAKAFTCPYDDCNRVYSRNSNLKQHILIKHEKIAHECTICGAELSTKARLVLHMKRHTEPNITNKPPKTKVTGRKARKDMGTMKVSTAQKLAGVKKEIQAEVIPGIKEDLKAEIIDVAFEYSLHCNRN